MWNLKIIDTNELGYKTKRLTDLENELVVAGGGRGGIVRGFGMCVYILLYLQWITNQELL